MSQLSVHSQIGGEIKLASTMTYGQGVFHVGSDLLLSQPPLACPPCSHRHSFQSKQRKGTASCVRCPSYLVVTLSVLGRVRSTVGYNEGGSRIRYTVTHFDQSFAQSTPNVYPVDCLCCRPHTVDTISASSSTFSTADLSSFFNLLPLD
jgi:hypothetical protein